MFVTRPVLLAAVCVVSGAWLVSVIIPPATGAPRDATPNTCEDAAKSDLDRLQGTWVCTYKEEEGKVLPVPDDGEFTAKMSNISIIQGDLLLESREAGKEPEKFLRIKLDPSTRPKQVDFISEAPKQEFAGIYRLEGDTFTLCITIDPDAPVRPIHFVTKAGLPLVLLKYKRMK